MPVQTFAPMTKDFATFDCDAHVTEPPRIWERAHAYLTRDELEALKATIWWDAESQQLLVNGKAGAGIGSPRRGGMPGTMRVITNAGPGVKHDIQRALNVRNLNPKTALTQEHVAYLDHAGSYEPEPRLQDVDIQGIDQVMIIPTDIDTYPWLHHALGAKAFCKAYNQWAYEYTLADPERLFCAALLPMQNPQYAVEEVYRVAAQGCRVVLVRPMDAMGNYPMQPKYEPVWNALEETGLVYGMHPFPAGGNLKPPGYAEQYSGAELIRRTISTAGLPHSFLSNVQNFQAEAALWVTTVLMTGFFERHPRINAAVFEASSTWLSFLLDECDKAYRLYRNERQLPPLKRLPSETFCQHCITGFEGDEAPPSRFPEFYRDILAWSSDVYHHTHPYYDPLWAELESLGVTAAVHPTPGLWNPEWTSHGPFVEKIRGRLHQAPLIGGGVGPFAGGGSGTQGAAAGTGPLGHPLAPILSYWLDNHMFVASTLIGFTVMQRYPKMKVVVAHGKASWMEEVLEKMEASTRVIPLLHYYPVRTDPEAMWEEGHVMLGFDAEERLIQKLPHDFAAKVIWGSRYPHHDTTSAWDAITMLTRANVEESLDSAYDGGERRPAVWYCAGTDGGRLERRSGTVRSPDRRREATRVRAGFPAPWPSPDLAGGGDHRHLCHGDPGLRT